MNFQNHRSVYEIFGTGFIIYAIGFILAILTTHPETNRYMCPNSTENYASYPLEISGEQCAPTVLTAIIIM